MSRILVCRFFVMVVLGLGLPGPAKAGIVLLTNPNQFSGHETLLTFQGVQPFENVTSYGGVGFQTLGLPPGTGIEGAFDPTPLREFGPQEGTILNQYRFDTQGVQLTLPSAENRLAFELWTNPNAGGDLSIDLFAAGTPVTSFTIPNRGTTEYFFYGFESSTSFDTMILRGPGDGRFSMDNLRFELVVPEPGTLTLASLGAFGMLGYFWRRQG